MAAARNITSSLPDDLIRKAKVHAAKCNSTVNALVRKLLEEALSDGRRTRAAAGRLLAIAAAARILTAIHARSAGHKYMRDVKAFFDTTILMYLYGGAIRRNQPRRRNYSMCRW
jgi:hypothetical protein